MPWLVLEPGLVLLAAGATFFVLLGLLLLFFEDLDLKLVIGVGAILLGGTLGALAANEGAIAAILVAVIAALVASQVLERTVSFV